MSDSKFSCPICVDNYEDPKNICSTVCGHIFHFTCLLQWQEESNTCPMCNRTNPAPHRIFLDIKAVTEDEKKVVIKGIPPNEMTTTPLSNVVMKLVGIMRVSIREHNFEVTKVGNSLHVTFNSVLHKDKFLGNKFKLKTNPQSSSVVMHEVVNAEIRALFQYAHKLKECGYSIFFIRKKKVYVKKTKHSGEINMLSKEHVDRICSLATNATPPPVSVPAPVRRRRTVVENNDHSQQREDAPTNLYNDATRARTGTTEDADYDDIYWREFLLSFDRDSRDLVTNEPQQDNMESGEQHTSCMASFKRLFKKLCDKLKRIVVC